MNTLTKIHLSIVALVSSIFLAISPAYALNMEPTGIMQDSTSQLATQEVKTTLNETTDKQPEGENAITDKTSQKKESTAAEKVQPEVKTDATKDLETAKKVDTTKSKNNELKEETNSADIAEDKKFQVQQAAETSASTNAANGNISMKCATPKNGWKTENGKVHFYNKGKIQTGWIIDSSYKNYGLQRYWMGAYGNLATNKISKTDANGSLTYSTKAGYVARNKFKESDGKFYLANNDGKLESTTGWLVTGKYDGGALQRYYVEASSHSVKLGFFKVDNNLYHGDGNQGFVIRWKTAWGNGILLADNDGVIYQKEGWLVTDKYDGHLERYRVDYSCGQYMGAHVGFFVLNGSKYRGLEGVGYVLRNSEYMEGAKFYYANNDGVISYTGSIADRVALIWQNPELPLGCESVAITAVLRAWGFSLSKTAMNDSYIPRSSWDWVYAFAGNGRSNAINGCMPPAVVTGANKFLSEKGTNLRANNIKGTSWNDILNLVKEGYPVVVWHTINNVYPNVTSSRDGYPYYPATEHCVVVCGVSGSSVKVADSLAGMVWRDSGTFGNIYNACWKCAVVVR